MKRRDFIKRSTGGALAAGLIPVADNSSAQAKNLSGRKSDKWRQMGTGKTEFPDRRKILTFDVAVFRWRHGRYLRGGIRSA